MIKFQSPIVIASDETKSIQEGSQAPQELLSLSMDDKELVRRIDQDVLNSMPLYQKMKQIQDENEQYYLGTYMDKARFDYELPADQNILYRNLETIISIITAKRREPIVLPAQETDESKELAQKTQQHLTWKWSDEDMAIKFEDWVRAAYLDRIGVLKIRWDYERDDYAIENKRPQEIMIDKDAKDEYGAKFIIEFKEDSLDELITLFPKAKKDLLKQFGDKLGTQIKYLEYWTNEFVVMKVNSIVLEKKKNPYWNWDEKNRKENLAKLKEQWMAKVKDQKLKNLLLNYFNEPRKPYVILSLKNLGKGIYADTTDFEQGKRGQDIVNRRKRQIDKAAIHGLGREVYSGSYITKEEAKKSISNPNAPMWLEKGNPQEAVSHIAPEPMSEVIWNDLNDTKNELDNTMGTHGTTRGERGAQETAAGRTLLREGDLGRIDLSVRRIDKKLELLYCWMLQMAKVFYDEAHWSKILGSEGAATYLKFSSDDIEDGQEIIVKSELTADKATQRQEATDRMVAKVIDPLTYFEKFDETNAKEMARRVVYYTMDPKLYVTQFCMDENTPGMETLPQGQAIQENKRLMAGEVVPPNQAADNVHIEEHAKFAKSGEFQNADDTVKNNFTTHVRAEVNQLKQLTQSVGPKPMAQPQTQANAANIVG